MTKKVIYLINYQVVNQFNNFIVSYKIILKVLNEICRKQNFIHQIRKTKFSVLKLIALILIAEYKSKNIENQLLK